MANEPVDYGYGPVAPLPVPARERPVIPDPELVIISPDGARAIGRNIEAERRAGDKNADRLNEIHGLAKTLTDGGKHPARVRMPSGAEITVGGEALIGALARGAQPVE